MLQQHAASLGQLGIAVPSSLSFTDTYHHGDMLTNVKPWYLMRLSMLRPSTATPCCCPEQSALRDAAQVLRTLVSKPWQLRQVKHAAGQRGHLPQQRQAVRDAARALRTLASEPWQLRHIKHAAGQRGHLPQQRQVVRDAARALRTLASGPWQLRQIKHAARQRGHLPQQRQAVRDAAQTLRTLASEPWQLRQIKHAARQRGHLPQQRQAVGAHSRVLAHDEHAVKECVNGPRYGLHLHEDSGQCFSRDE